VTVVGGSAGTTGPRIMIAAANRMGAIIC
jgi:hypothetical protein